MAHHGTDRSRSDQLVEVVFVIVDRVIPGSLILVMMMSSLEVPGAVRVSIKLS